jgi:hypothetical protein
MMKQLNLQFTSAAAVYKAYGFSPPSMVSSRRLPGETPAPDLIRAMPVDFLLWLHKDAHPKDTITYAAHLLPKREAIWWGLRCLRKLQPEPTEPEEKCLRMAEAWLKDPSDQRRRGALEMCLQGDTTRPAVLLAMAVAMSGGSIGPDPSINAPAPPGATPQALAGALTTLIYTQPHSKWRSTLDACIEECKMVLGVPSKAMGLANGAAH